nr:putative peptidyl-tRNA hydrolase PTRHD1 isoform X2 [Equus asinus]
MSQRALRSHRTKTWQRSGPLPGPGMHRGVGPIFLLGRNMAASGAEPQILVQYLVLRKDLSQTPFSWPAGALVAQACHAATAALHIHRDHPHTVAYLRELGRMRKVVLEEASSSLFYEGETKAHLGHVTHQRSHSRPQMRPP